MYNPLSLLTGGKTEEQKQAEQEQAIKVEEGDVASVSALRDFGNNQNSAFDNEWAHFLSDLSQNEGIQDIVRCIESQEWTDNQKSKLMYFAQIALGRNIGTTYITNNRDYQMAVDEYTLAEVNLTLGLTVFDMDANWLMLIDLIKQNFLISLRRSKGGFMMDKVGVSRVEFSRDTQRNENGYKSQNKD